MKTFLNCIPCLIRQALDVLRISTYDNSTREQVLKEVIEYLLEEDWTKTPAELSTRVYGIIKKRTKQIDPYKKLKEKSNKLAAKLYPQLKLMVSKSRNPLFTATKIAAAGNAIDFGPQGIKINILKNVREVLESDFAINDFEKLERSLLEIKNILYLADNAGETFFDKVLIEELVKNGKNVTYVVKGSPIINDATLIDVAIAKIDKVAEIITTGTDCCGIVFNECSNKFKRKFETSELIISKGQGNYESLSDMENRNIYFLLKIKCSTLAEEIGVEEGAIILKKG